MIALTYGGGTDFSSGAELARWAVVSTVGKVRARAEGRAWRSL
jgi:hypothetical protein